MREIAQQVLALERPSVLMTVALPGAGKTTAVTEIFKAFQTLEPTVHAGVVCADDIRLELAAARGLTTGYDRDLNTTVFETAAARARAIVDMGGIALIDATHLNRFREETVDRYRSMGATTVAGLVLDVPLETVKTVNEARFRNGNGYVDPADIDRMEAYRQAHPLDPETPEPFDVVFQVMPDIPRV